MRQACFKFRWTREFNGIVYWYKRASQHTVVTFDLYSIWYGNEHSIVECCNVHGRYGIEIDILH